MKLEDHPFISSVPQERLASVLDEVELLHLEAGALIFEENSPPDALFLVLEGTVGFTARKPDGSLQDVSKTGEGSFFGEVGVFTGEHRALGAYAQTDAVVGRIPEPTVQRIFKDAEPVKKVLLSVISHLKNTTSHYMDDMIRTEKLSLVGTMVSSILHDFKNPFSIISLGSHLILQRHGDDPKTRKVCRNIESQIRRMVDMANDLAAFARGEDEIEIAHISVDALFTQFRELNAPFFSDATVRMECRANDVQLQGDSSKLLRVLQNLVTNAIEAIHQTDRPGRIHLEADEEGEYAIIRLTDNGPGIPAEIHDNFFEPFITFGKSDGTGLGTAIAKSIVTAHRGEIDFETGADGTTFTIRLPKRSPRG